MVNGLWSMLEKQKRYAMQAHSIGVENVKYVRTSFQIEKVNILTDYWNPFHKFCFCRNIKAMKIFSKVLLFYLMLLIVKFDIFLISQ